MEQGFQRERSALWSRVGLNAPPAKARRAARVVRRRRVYYQQFDGPIDPSNFDVPEMCLIAGGKKVSLTE